MGKPVALLQHSRVLNGRKIELQERFLLNHTPTHEAGGTLFGLFR